MYYVWKRSDGHVGVSTFMPETLHCAKSSHLTFEKLYESSSWNDVLTFMGALQ